MGQALHVGCDKDREQEPQISNQISSGVVRSGGAPRSVRDDKAERWSYDASERDL